MFWDKWIPKAFLVRDQVLVLEYCHRDNGSTYHLSHIKRNKEGAEIIYSESSNTIQPLKKYQSSKRLPLLIVVTGKSVMHKKIELNENSYDLLSLIPKTFPALNHGEFYIQLFELEQNCAYVSLCRKFILDNLLDEIKLFNLEIASVTIGATAIMGIEPFLGDTNTIVTNSNRIEFSNGEIAKISNLQENAQSDDLPFYLNQTLLMPNQILGFAKGLGYLLQKNVSVNYNAELKTIHIQHISRNKFRFALMVLTTITFIISMTNMFLYTSYFDKLKSLDSELLVYETKYDEVSKVISNYKKNKSIIENTGLLSKALLSEYADKIAMSLPDEITLSELHFNPKIENDLETDSLIKFNNNILFIKGNCSKSGILNQWLGTLKMHNFVKEISLEKFTYNNEGLQPNFIIKINI